MKSPCIDVCVVDEANGLCRGCARTLDEIARWSSMSEADHARVLAALPTRKRGQTPVDNSDRFAANKTDVPIRARTAK